jgi:tetratricopeptide (TPR) repeat protein
MKIVVPLSVWILLSCSPAQCQVQNMIVGKFIDLAVTGTWNQAAKMLSQFQAGTGDVRDVPRLIAAGAVAEHDKDYNTAKENYVHAKTILEKTSSPMNVKLLAEIQRFNQLLSGEGHIPEAAELQESINRLSQQHERLTKMVLTPARNKVITQSPRRYGIVDILDRTAAENLDPKCANDIECLTGKIGESPANPYFYTMRADEYEDQCMYAEALADYEKAIKLRSTMEQAKQARAALLQKHPELAKP